MQSHPQLDRLDSRHAQIMVTEMDQFVGLLDREGRMVEVNQTALDAVGAKRADVIGTYFWDTPWWNVNAETIQLLKDSIKRAAQGELVRCDVQNFVNGPGGLEVVDLDFSLKPVRGESGEVLYLLPEGRNITAKKAAEAELLRLNDKLRELDAMRTSFFANVSHELRTPLALILGAVRRMIASRIIPEQASAALGVVERNASLLIKHVNDLLDIAKLDAGKLALAPESFDLARLTRRVAGMFVVLAEDAEITLSIDVPDALPVHADPDKLQRVLLNLLGNAFKFTPKGGTIRVAIVREPATVAIHVADSGPGIPAGRRVAIFERFRQDSSGDNRMFGGTGLGLAIAKEFAELHGGTLAAGSAEPEGGALFTLSLPANVLGATAAESAAESLVMDETARATLSELNAERRGRERRERGALQERPLAIGAGPGAPVILLVEDNDEMNQFIAEALAPEYQVIQAYDGHEGLALAMRADPDLIITDVMMPRRSGDELLRDLRADKSLDHVPVIVLTAKADESLRVRLLENGAQDFLNKPFAVPELKARVRVHLDLKVARDALRAEVTGKDDSIASMARELAARSRTLAATADELKVAARAKDQFLMTLSHELRTPLTAIYGWTQLLRNEPFDQSSMDTALETIDRSARTQLRLVSDLLDMSSLVSGKMRLDLRPLDLRRAVTGSLTMMEPTIAAAGLTVSVDLGPFPAHVDGDLERLNQIVSNLLTNAVKFTPRGGSIAITLACIGAEVTMAVTDTGRGIDAVAIPRLFERFWQADSSTTRTEGGLGIGLALVRHLTELHGGHVEAASPGRGHGATFTVTLPRLGATLATAGPTLQGPLKESPTGPILAGRNVLLVEDDDDTRSYLAVVLQNAGANVVMAKSAAEAYDHYQRERPDLLISDIGLPGDDGLALLTKIRADDTAQRLPSLAMSAYVRDADRDSILKGGFDRFLAKPASPAEILGAVQGLLA